jgi:predicted small metal-binding protein
MKMVKTYTCRDLGVDCDWSASHETEEGLMEIIYEHAIKVHGENPAEYSPEVIAQIKGAFKDK